MTTVENWSTILGGVAAALAILGFFLRYATRPIRHLVKDLGPLIDRNSDGNSVFDEVRARQKEDSAKLQQLVDEFPKNGVPTRTTVDALKLSLAELLTKQADIAADLADVKAAQKAHVQLHLAGPQNTPQQRRRTT